MDTDEIVELARTLPRDQFLLRVTSLLLVVTESAPESKPFAFQTVAASPGAHRKAPPGGETTDVYELAKAKGNPYPDQISVGRTRNCDVVLRSPSVSKLHARFRQEASGDLVLVDNGSQNGTRVNGQVLVENEPHQVSVGDVIQFGRLTTTLMDAAALFEQVRAQARRERDLGRR